jgi:quercetin dioxygenase-like cupin family protein
MAGGESHMLKTVSVAIIIALFAGVPARAQTPTPPDPQTPPAPTTEKPAAPASEKPAEPAAPASPAGGQTTPARGGGPAKTPQTGNPDPGVTFTVLIDNPRVRVLQVNLQPGAVRRPHVHNDVTFHMMVPVTGSLELMVEKEPVVTTVAGQAYYMVKGQTHSFTNKGSAAAQVIELFIKPDPAIAPPATEGATTAAPTAASPAVPPPAPAAPPPTAPAK